LGVSLLKEERGNLDLLFLPSLGGILALLEKGTQRGVT